MELGQSSVPYSPIKRQPISTADLKPPISYQEKSYIVQGSQNHCTHNHNETYDSPELTLSLNATEIQGDINLRSLTSRVFKCSV